MLRRRFSGTAWIIIILALIATITGLLNKVAATVFSFLPPWIAFILIIILAIIGIVITLRREGQQSESQKADNTRASRQRVLEYEKDKWISGFLENRLYYDADLLPLSLCAYVGGRYNRGCPYPPTSLAPLPPDTTITQVFDQHESQLLILGKPGAGKTTLLLELARDLLQRAKDNERAPIPVVFTLSSWATKKLSLEQWIVEELERVHTIDSWVGKAWIETNQLILLLDGLDEIAPEVQPACLEAVNKYI